MVTFSADDHRHMARALRLARRGLYTADPNPRVGCVLVRDGEIVGEGFHARAGSAHAEVNALSDAGDRARGATAYVTLEPCSHHGRTPPCVEALIDAGVARVIAAMADPNPQVAGGGLAALAAAGVETAEGLMAQAARRLNPGFIARMTRGRPWVRVKLAASLDGRTAMASGESRWITSAAARRDVHRWRARSSAMLTGIETALADDPRLTARDVPGAERQPRRYVLDTHLRLPVSSTLVSDGGGVTVFHGEAPVARLEELAACGVETRAVALDVSGRPDLPAVLAAMAGDECNEVLVEAGPRLGGALVQAGLVDELIIYMAPHLMGHEGRPLLSLVGLGGMSDRIAVTIDDARRIGEDLRLIGRIGLSRED